MLESIKKNTKLRDYLFGHWDVFGASRDLMSKEEQATLARMGLSRDLLGLQTGSKLIDEELELNDTLQGNQITFKFTSFKMPTSFKDALPK